jgi:hypothetical protein
MKYYLTIKNWAQFQHYTKRSPPWIKLYRDTLTSTTWVTASDSQRVLLIASILLASQNNNRILADSLYFKRAAYLNQTPELGYLIESDFADLIDENGEVQQNASELLATLAHHASPEQSRAEHKKLAHEDQFEVFWKAYPKKKNRGDAEKAWAKLKLGNGLFDHIMQAIKAACACRDWQKDGGAFIPYPASWLNAKGWQDEYKQREQEFPI